VQIDGNCKVPLSPWGWHSSLQSLPVHSGG
jgi:hypothetical protein